MSEPPLGNTDLKVRLLPTSENQEEFKDPPTPNANKKVDPKPSMNIIEESKTDPKYELQDLSIKHALRGQSTISNPL